MRKLVGAAVLIAAGLVLTGCSGNDVRLAALETEQTAQDELPDYISEIAVEDGQIIADSVRFAVEREGYAFYLARSAPSELEGEDPKDAVRSGGVCIVVDNLSAESSWRDTSWVAGCGGISGNEPSQVSGAGVIASVIPDDYNPDEQLENGWEQVHPNVLVKGL